LKYLGYARDSSYGYLLIPLTLTVVAAFVPLLWSNGLRWAKRILVVEDGYDLRTIIVAVLTRVGGYETVEATNGREAVDKAVSEKPDLILIDVATSPTFQGSMWPGL
jgi:hypothetical protein